MARQEREYRRLPGRGRKRGGFFTITRIRASLWAGKDHLLCLFSTGYTEDYKRFYYRDIQAIVRHKTPRFMVWNILSGLFLALFAGVAATATSTVWAAFYWILAGFFFLVLAGNVMLGPTCICVLQTAVSREELPSLCRERNAEKTLGIVKPLIEAAQGSVSREEIAAKSQELAGQSDAMESPRSGEHRGSAVSSYGGNVHQILFYLLILDGVLSAIHLVAHGPALGIIGSLFWLAVSVVLIIALTRQQGGLTRGLRTITWAAFGYMAATFLLGYVQLFYMTITNPGAMSAMGNSQWEMFKLFSNLSPSDNPVLMATVVLSVACATPLGISGLILLRKFGGRQNSLPANPELSFGQISSTARPE